MKLKWIANIKAIVDGTTNVHEIVNTIDNWTQQKINAYLNESFYDIINYSYKNIPYYHKLFIDNGLNPKEFNDQKLITKIPILTKEIIRTNYTELRPKNLSTLKYQTRRSGGTTGEPIESLISNEAAAFETFAYFKGLIWMGWKPSMTLVKLFGGSLGVKNKFNLRKTVYNYATNSINIPAFEIDSNTVKQYYKLLKAKKQICIIGYASAINSLVYYLKKNNLHLNNVKLVITTSEALIEDWKVNINTYFQCEVRSYYGCGEVGSLGYQIAKQNTSYQIPQEHVILESQSNTNELLITQLHNKSQPLIRYSNGDIGIIETVNNRPIIKNLIGRKADFFTRSDGTKVSPILGTFSIQKSNIQVKKYQYIQYKDLIIEFRYIMEDEDKNITKKEEEVISKIIDNVMSEKTKLIFVKSNLFEISSSKKHRITTTMDRNYYNI